MLIRPATHADRPALTALQLASWRSAYRGLLSDAYLAGPVEADLAQLWTRDQAARDFRLVAERAGTGVGLVAVVEKNDTPYVDNLHVAPAAKGQGIGRALMRAAAVRLRARGDDRLWLTVIAQNHAAIAFYRRIGGEVGVPIADELFGQPIHSCAVHWHTLDAML